MAEENPGWGAPRIHGEAFPQPCPYRYAVLDRDGKVGQEVTDLLAASAVKPTRTSAASPRQNGIAERWTGSCRRELLDHVIVLNELHLRRLIRDYIFYYRVDRIHDSFEKDTPAMRSVSCKPGQSARLVRSRVLVVCITDMIGRRLPERVSLHFPGSSSISTA